MSEAELLLKQFHEEWYGRQVLIVPVDVYQEEVRQILLWRVIKESSPIHGKINAAGWKHEEQDETLEWTAIRELSEETWLKIIEWSRLKLFGVLYCINEWNYDNKLVPIYVYDGRTEWDAIKTSELDPLPVLKEDLESLEDELVPDLIT